MHLCNNTGHYETRTIAKSHGDSFGYRASKKLKWGDSWKYPLRIPNKLRKDFRNTKNTF